MRLFRHVECLTSPTPPCYSAEASRSNAGNGHAAADASVRGDGAGVLRDDAARLLMQAIMALRRHSWASASGGAASFRASMACPTANILSAALDG